MRAIFKREWKACFTNVTGWLFLGVVIAMYGLYFYFYNLYNGYPYISSTLSATSILMMIAVPVLTMRSFAEDRKSKVEQLILTSPVSVGKIVLAKYLSMVAVYTVDILVIAATPLLLSISGTIPLGESYVAILGFWLYGCAFIAIGMFMSSMTENQIIAAVLSFLALFVGYMMGAITGLISEKLHWLVRILNAYDLYTPFYKFLSGCLDLTGIVYYLGIIALFVFLTGHMIRRKHFRSRTLVFSEPIIALSAVVLCNIGVNALPVAYTSWDCTYAKIYGITDTTKDILKNLENDIKIYVLSNEDKADEQLRQTLKRYEDLSSHITVSYVDPVKSPTFYQSFSETAPSESSLIVVSDKRYKLIDYEDIYLYSYDMDYSTFQYVTTLSGYDAEGRISSAIEFVTLEDRKLPVAYYLSGHGEAELGSHFTDALKKSNITLKELNLMTQETVPEDAKALIINGPSLDLNEADAGKIISYLKSGGKVLYALNYQHRDLKNFNSVLGAYGVKPVEGMIAENDSKYYHARFGPLYLLPKVADSSYTKGSGNRYILFPGSIGLEFPESTDTVNYLALLQTTKSSVSKVASEVTTWEKEEGDIIGPFTVALAVEEKQKEDALTQFVVFGSYLMVNDEIDSEVSGANAALFTTVMSNMVTEVELKAGQIPVKKYTLSTVYVPSTVALPLGLGCALGIPLILLITGIVIWVLRRRK